MPITSILRANNASQDSSGSYFWEDLVEVTNEDFLFSTCNLVAAGPSNILYTFDFANAAAAIPAGSTINSLKIRAINIGLTFDASDIEIDSGYWMFSGVPIGTYSVSIGLTNSLQDIEMTVTTGLPTRSQIVSSDFGIGISVVDYAWGAGVYVYLDELSLQVDYTPPVSARSGVIGGGVGRGMVL